MQCQSAYRIIAITILGITHYRMTDIQHVYTDLVFTSGFQFKFHQRIPVTDFQRMVMCYRKFASIVSRRGVGDEGFVVF